MPASPLVQCRPYFKLRQFTRRFRLATEAPAPWSVPALCAAYDWPKGLAGGGVIAIVELGGGWVQSDMTQYFGSISQPAPQITDVSVDGTKNSPNQSVGSQSDPDYEVALDIQVAGAAYYAATGSRHDPHVLVAGHGIGGAEGGAGRMRCVHHLMGR